MTQSREAFIAYQRAYYQKNKEKKLAYQRAYDAARSPRINRRINGDYKRYYLSHKAAKLAYDRKRNYGLDFESQQELLGKPCAICGDKATCIDHCHKTGKVRAALCKSCNVGIGYFRDNPALLRSSAEYLEAHGATG